MVLGNNVAIFDGNGAEIGNREGQKICCIPAWPSFGNV